MLKAGTTLIVIISCKTPCGDVGWYQRFVGPGCLHLPPWRWQQRGPMKRWYPTTLLYGAMTRRPRLVTVWSPRYETDWHLRIQLQNATPNWQDCMWSVFVWPYQFIATKQRYYKTDNFRIGNRKTRGQIVFIYLLNYEFFNRNRQWFPWRYHDEN
jgi:hypothetical protein